MPVLTVELIPGNTVSGTIGVSDSSEESAWSELYTVYPVLSVNWRMSRVPPYPSSVRMRKLSNMCMNERIRLPP